MKKRQAPSCASCEAFYRDKICVNEKGRSSKGCPTLLKRDLLSEANKAYEDETTREFARQASLQEAECYANRHQRPYVMQPEKSRIVEICEFAERMGYKRLGLAFCIGLAQEASIVEEVFKGRGFEVVSVVCKAGRTPKEQIGIKDAEKIYQ